MLSNFNAWKYLKRKLWQYGQGFKRVLLAALWVAIICPVVSYAAGGTAMDLTAIQTTLGDTVITLAKIFVDISLIAGVGFIMAALFKLHQHKLNPTQVPISQGITLLLVGAALLLFPKLLTLATGSAFGETDVAQISGSAIAHILGGGGK